MRPFLYDRAISADLATRASAAFRDAMPVQGRMPAEYLAGGTIR